MEVRLSGEADANRSDGPTGQPGANASSVPQSAKRRACPSLTRAWTAILRGARSCAASVFFGFGLLISTESRGPRSAMQPYIFAQIGRHMNIRAGYVRFSEQLPCPAFGISRTTYLRIDLRSF